MSIYWYAVCVNDYDAWDYGAYDKDEAISLADEAISAGDDAYIVVVDESCRDSVAVGKLVKQGKFWVEKP